MMMRMTLEILPVVIATLKPLLSRALERIIQKRDKKEEKKKQKRKRRRQSRKKATTRKILVALKAVPQTFLYRQHNSYQNMYRSLNLEIRPVPSA